MTQAEWTAVISECRSSGQSARVWCENHGYKYTAYCYWNKKLNREKQQWGQVLPEPELAGIPEVRLQCGKWTIAVGEDFSPKLLADVLKVVSSVC